jgi:hypothetical protein
MDGGWIKIWRKVQNNAIFTDDALFKCWIYCLMQATHKNLEFTLAGKIVNLRPGEFISGREKANRDLKWSGKKFDRKMQFLEKHGYLTREVTSHFTKNTILNWDIYQISSEETDQQSDLQVTSTRPAGDQRVTTNKNVKNVKNDKNKLTDEEFLFSLKEKFTWVDFDSVMVKMDAWLLAHPERHKTRKFIVNWLNKIEKPMQVKISDSLNKNQPPNINPGLDQMFKDAIREGWK